MDVIIEAKTNNKRVLARASTINKALYIHKGYSNTAHVGYSGLIVRWSILVLTVPKTRVSNVASYSWILTYCEAKSHNLFASGAPPAGPPHQPQGTPRAPNRYTVRCTVATSTQLYKQGKRINRIASIKFPDIPARPGSFVKFASSFAISVNTR